MIQIVNDRRIVERLAPLCICCADNPDAITALWIVWHALKGQVECEITQPNTMPKTDMLGRDLIVVGAEYTPSLVAAMAERAVSVEWITTLSSTDLTQLEHNVHTIKTGHSVAHAAWSHYHPTENYPTFAGGMVGIDYAMFQAALNNSINKG